MPVKNYGKGKPGWFRILQGTAGIFLPMIVVSCAVSNTQSPPAERYYTGIKHRHVRKQPPACIHMESKHPDRKGIFTQFRQRNRLHADKLAFHRTEKKKQNSSPHPDGQEFFSGPDKTITGNGLPERKHFPDALPQPVQVNDAFGPDPSGIPVSPLWINETVNYGKKGVPPDYSIEPAMLNHSIPDLSRKLIKQESNTYRNHKDYNKAAGNLYMHMAKREPLQTRSFPKRENMVCLAALLIGLLSFAGIKYAPQITSDISSWAYMNPWKTRGIIACMHFLLGSSAFMLGERLADQGTYLPALSRTVLLAALSSSALLYPVRKARLKLFRYSYLRQKTHDLAIVLSASMLMVYAGNHYANPVSALTGRTNSPQSDQFRVFPAGNSQSLFRPALYQYNQPPQDESNKPQKKELTQGQKIALTILSVFGFVLLAFGLVVLSCAIYCNGLEALAFVVGIGGGALLITALYFILRAIHRPKRKKTVVAAQWV